jgi:hypothetical protein
MSRTVAPDALVQQEEPRRIQKHCRSREEKIDHGEARPIPMGPRLSPPAPVAATTVRCHRTGAWSPSSAAPPVETAEVDAATTERSVRPDPSLVEIDVVPRAYMAATQT